MRSLQFIFLLIALSATAIVGFQSLVSTGAPSSVTHFDKIMHFTAYAILAGLWRLALPKAALNILICWIVTYGASLEIAQHFMAQGRTGSLLDALANGLGAICGGYVGAAVLNVVSRSRLKGDSVTVNAPSRRKDFPNQGNAL